MSKAQLVITAVVLEGRSKSEVARDYDVSRNWVQQLVKRYGTEGAAAFEPHSSRPTTILARSVRDSRKKIVRLSTATVAPSTRSVLPDQVADALVQRPAHLVHRGPIG